MDEQLGLAGPRLLIVVNRIFYLFKIFKMIEDMSSPSQVGQCFINTAAEIGVTRLMHESTNKSAEVSYRL
jgi:hypothetical protein